MTSISLAGHAHLPDGTVATATKTITVGPSAPSTMFGVDPSRSGVSSGPGSDFANDIAWFPGARVGATYSQAGEGMLGWTSPWVAPMVAAGYRISFSAKDYTNISALKAQWDAMPSPRPGMGIDPYEYILFHECNRPSGGPILATWRTAFAAAVVARNAHPNAARIKLGPNFTWWPAAVAGANPEGIPWRSFIGTGNLRPDFLSWDQYWAAGMGTIDTADEFTALPWQSGQEFGLPVSIREFGVSGSFSDAAAATVIPAVVASYRNRKFAHVSQFNYRAGVSGAWLTPDGRPLAFNAWKLVCANQ